MVPDQTRVLVVDDSELFREGLAMVIHGHQGMDIVGTASSGEEAVRLVKALRPDIITMDLHMPGMGGMAAIQEIMAHTPTPILVLTADDRDSMGFEAVSKGALELQLKPVLVPRNDAAEAALCERLSLLASVKVVRHMSAAVTSRLARAPSGPVTRKTKLQCVGVVASTGGPSALAALFKEVPADLPVPIVVVQHLPKGFAHGLAEWLNTQTPLRVRVATPGPMVAGEVLIAPYGRHVVIKRNFLKFGTNDPQDGHLPSGTVLLSSIAETYGASGAGVVLTGMGRDGAAGLLRIKEAGGQTWAQDEASCIVYGMPRVAVALNSVLHTQAPGIIGAELCKAAGRRS